MNADTLHTILANEQQRQSAFEDRILCCTVAGCESSGAAAVRAAIQEQILAEGRAGKTEVCGTGCMGLCCEGPLVRSSAADAVFTNVQPGDASALVSRDYTGFAGRMLKADHPFYAGQRRMILANSGYADPERFADYVARGG